MWTLGVYNMAYVHILILFHLFLLFIRMYALLYSIRLCDLSCFTVLDNAKLCSPFIRLMRRGDLVLTL